MKNAKKKTVDNFLTLPPRTDLMAVRAQVICQLSEKGYRTTEIATITNIDKSTVSRTLKECKVEITSQVQNTKWKKIM